MAKNGVYLLFIFDLLIAFVWGFLGLFIAFVYCYFRSGLYSEPRPQIDWWYIAAIGLPFGIVMSSVSGTVCFSLRKRRAASVWQWLLFAFLTVATFDIFWEAGQAEADASATMFAFIFSGVAAAMTLVAFFVAVFVGRYAHTVS